MVAGSGVWAEDGWLGRRIRIRAVELRAVKLCERCVVTTIDQNPGRYRNIGQRLLFGMDLIPDGTGLISVGQPVAVVD
jgi:uncharacterized protein